MTSSGVRRRDAPAGRIETRNRGSAGAAPQTVKRCAWAGDEPLLRAYHDEEWGVPVHDDRTLFEFLILEGAQAGLSWETILRKQAAYRTAFASFDPVKVSRYGEQQVTRLLADPGIVRNRLKIVAAIENARRFLRVQQEHGSFDRYIWQFSGDKPITHRFRTVSQIPTETGESRAMSADLRKRGFRFVGPTICHAFMQATGLVNDHVMSCFRYREL